MELEILINEKTDSRSDYKIVIIRTNGTYLSEMVDNCMITYETHTGTKLAERRIEKEPPVVRHYCKEMIKKELRKMSRLP